MSAKAQNHSDRKHALLSASGASRWLNCTPSARLEEKFEDKKSVYAEEGTVAHELADVLLRQANDQLTPAKAKKLVAAIEAMELYSEDMPEYVDQYTSYVLEEFTAAKQRTEDALLLVEEKVDLTEFIENGFGTNDAIIIADDEMEVIDLKYGRGIKVEAEENPQLKLYGLGALLAYELTYDIKVIRLTIVQPRLNHIVSWKITADELRKWGEKTVKPLAKKAYKGEGVQKAGDWCKFCKAKATCATIASVQMKLAKHEFKDPHLLTDKQVLDIYKKLPMLIDWANAVDKYVLESAIDGKEWPGFKLVEGRSNRKWSNEQGVVDFLRSDGYENEQFMISKLAGIGAIEKLVGKTNFSDLLGKFVIKPQGAPTIVPEDDKRPALGSESAKADFED